MDRNALKPVLAGGALALGLIAALATGEAPADRDPQSALLLRVVDEEGSSLLSRGTPAPDFELPDTAGENTVRLEDLKGESSAAVFVSFSCPFSRQLIRTVLDEGLPDLGKRMLFIQRGDTGREPTQEEANLQAELVAQFPLLEDADGSTFDAYKTSGVPTTYLLDSEGKVAASGVGEPEGAKLVRALAAGVLGQKGN